VTHPSTTPRGVPVLPSTTRLDLAPAQGVTSGAPRVVGVRTVDPRARRRWLLPWRDRLLLHADDAVHDVDAPGAPAVAARYVLPATADGPLVVTPEGRLAAWDRAPFTWPTGDLLHDVSVVGLGEHLMLTDHAAGTTRLVTRDGDDVWRAAGLLHATLPAAGLLLGLASDDTATVCAWSLVDGASAWRYTARAAVRQVVACVGDRLWVGLDDDRLLALDVATGEVRAAVQHPGVDGWRPGPVTADGLLVLLRPSELTVVDLWTASVDHHVLTPGLGDPMIVRADAGGHVLAVDDSRRVWSVDLREPRPVEAARAGAPATGLEVHDGAWWVVDQGGGLTTLR